MSRNYLHGLNVMVMFLLCFNLLGYAIPSHPHRVSAGPQKSASLKTIHPDPFTAPVVIQIASGGNSHTCALTSNGATSSGGVKCWGGNGSGQLGNGTTTDRWTPVDVEGLTSGATAVTAGDDHTCAITSSGGVMCWGYNKYGQLGNGTTTDSLTPVDVQGLSSGVTAIAAGSNHTCAVTSSGKVMCWGDNSSGQLGIGTTDDSLTPVNVLGLASGVTAVTAGYGHTCALTSIGGVKCWGKNEYGQLGNGTGLSYAIPVDVHGLTSGVTAIAAGFDHACALTSNGATSSGGVKCWGNNGYGQLGIGYYGPFDARWTPVDVQGLSSSVTAISAGRNHTCALTSNGATSSAGVECWGDNTHHQLGIEPDKDRWIPVDEPGLSSGITSVAAGGDHTCALTSNGATSSGGVLCWGDISSGSIPVDVPGLASSVSGITAGNGHTCALTSNGATSSGGIKCWGYNYYSQFKFVTYIGSVTPMDVQGLTSGVIAVDAGDWHTCAVTSSGAVMCWGHNSSGQLGNGTTDDSFTPVDVQGLTSGITAVTAGYGHTCALTSNGATSGGGVMCWGTISSSTIPVDVQGLASGVTAVDAGGYHSCALTSNGATSSGGVKCWGSNFSGQLGSGTTNESATPVDVQGLSGGVTAVAAGNQHTCALTSSGGVKCWGDNSRGQLGDGTKDESLTPVDVRGLSSGVIAVAAGSWHTCALTSSGGVKCWGYNNYGQLGRSTEPDRLIPVDVQGLTSGAAAIAVGYEHTCALTNGGGVKCWGSNRLSELGRIVFDVPFLVPVMYMPWIEIIK